MLDLDRLALFASWKSKPMVAQEVLDVMRTFLVGLERVSPWKPPFDVSGTTRRLAHMPIAEDLSDFDKVVLKAMEDPEVRFFSDSEPDTMRIRPDSRAFYGMGALFSNYPQKQRKKHAVSVNIGMGSSDQSSQSGVRINIPYYLPKTEMNGTWAMKDAGQPRAVFEYLIDFFDPYLCEVYSYNFSWSVVDRDLDKGLEIGLYTYSKSPKVRALLRNDPHVSDYRGGILFRLGDSVDMFRDPDAREAAIRIRDKFRAAKLTDWTEGIENVIPHA